MEWDCHPSPPGLEPISPHDPGVLEPFPKPCLRAAQVRIPRGAVDVFKGGLGGVPNPGGLTPGTTQGQDPRSRGCDKSGLEGSGRVVWSHRKPRWHPAQGAPIGCPMVTHPSPAKRGFQKVAELAPQMEPTPRGVEWDCFPTLPTLQPICSSTPRVLEPSTPPCLGEKTGYQAHGAHPSPDKQGAARTPEMGS